LGAIRWDPPDFHAAVREVTNKLVVEDTAWFSIVSKVFSGAMATTMTIPMREEKYPRMLFQQRDALHVT
jgi:hypothetical protein